MLHTDSVIENFPTKHPALRDTHLRLALRDARTAAMIARAYLYASIRYGDPITPDDLHLLAETSELLQHAQRMVDSNDIDVD